MFALLFSCLVILTSAAQAQEVDFDKEFPLSQDELNYPLIGENGELPSELEADRQFQQPFMGNHELSDEARFEQESADALRNVQKNIYKEPTKGLGYQPAKGTKSFNVSELPRTSDAKPQAITEDELVEMEASVTKLEQTIESIIGENIAIEVAPNTSEEIVEKYRPLIEFPNLTEKEGVDISDHGLFTKDTGGFNTNVWHDTSRKQAEEFLNKIQTSNLQSVTIREELVKLLLTKAFAPEGESDKNWLASRVSTLHSLGEVSHAGLLLSSAGLNVKNINHYEGLAKPWVESNLMHGRSKTVCPFVRQNILNTDNAFWHRALLVCQVLARDLKGLELSTNMLTEKMRRQDPFLFSLLDTIQGQSPAPMLHPEQKLNALHSSVYAESPKLLTPNVIPLLSDAVLRRIAKNVTLPLSVRLQAAEVLVNNYNEFDDIALLGLLYDKSEFDEKIVTSPAVDRYAEEEVDGSLARALLWQGSKVSGLPSTRALTLKALWERADRDRLFRLAARITPALRKISSDSNLAWLAPEVIRRSLQFGNIDTAKRWWQTLKINRSLSKELIDKRDNLEISFAFVNGKLSPQIFNKWFETKSLFDEKDREVIQRVLTFFEASEISFPTTVWQELHNTMDSNFIEKGKDVSSLWLRLLGSNLEAQNTAGAFMLLVDPLLQSNMHNLSEQTSGNIVTAFRFLGMDDVAKKLILESVLAD